MLVPAVNAKDDKARLPARRELGQWIPLSSDVEVLRMNGELQCGRINEWLDGLGDSQEPLEDEENVNIGVEDEGSRQLITKLLRVYRQLTADKGDCPPATSLSTEHHIDTGDAAPIMLKRRRQAQSESTVVEENVRKMLAAGVIEEGDGAWGFPVVLVRKKDGEWLMTSPNLTGKLHRWALTLQELDFDVQYRPGATNVVADALSKAPTTASVLAAIGKRRRARKRQAARTPAADAAEATNGMAEATNGSAEATSSSTEATSGTAETTSGTAEATDELKSGTAESSGDDTGGDGQQAQRGEDDGAGGGRAARKQAVRRKRVTWASDVIGGEELADRQGQGTKQSGGDGRRRPVRDGPHAGDDDVDQVAQADETAGPTETTGAKLKSDERTRMPRMEALRRTPAESRE
ncbi:hypothetical protein PR001_g28398, partial [Phytophthora rubi]